MKSKQQKLVGFQNSKFLEIYIANVRNDTKKTINNYCVGGRDDGKVINQAAMPKQIIPTAPRMQVV